MALAVGRQPLEQAQRPDGEGEPEVSPTSVGSTSVGDGPMTLGPADDGTSTTERRRRNVDDGTSTGEMVPEQSFPALSCAGESMLASVNGGEDINVVFTNVSGETRRAYWLNPGGNRVFLFENEDGEQAFRDTNVGHLWVITDDTDECVAILEAVEEVGGMDHEIDLY